MSDSRRLAAAWSIGGFTTRCRFARHWSLVQRAISSPILIMKMSGAGRDIHPFFRMVEHLQTTRLVLRTQNRERSVVAVRPRTQLSRLGRRQWRRIIPHPQSTDVAIDLVREERLREVEREREYRHQVFREFAHHPEIFFVGRPQTLRFPRPKIRMKVPTGFRRGEIGVVRHFDRPNHQAFVQIARRVDALAPPDALSLQGYVPPRHLRGWAKHLA